MAPFWYLVAGYFIRQPFVAMASPYAPKIGECAKLCVNLPKV